MMTTVSHMELYKTHTDTNPQLIAIRVATTYKKCPSLQLSAMYEIHKTSREVLTRSAEKNLLPTGWN